VRNGQLCESTANEDSRAKLLRRKKIELYVVIVFLIVQPTYWTHD